MEIRPPSLVNQLLEARFVAEAGVLAAQFPLLVSQAPRGSGQVLVLPGFMASDSATVYLRRFLRAIGYTVSGWQLGTNRGRMLDLLPDVVRRVERTVEDGGAPTRLVGWSRGGIIAREVARDRPELVRSVVTLGSPVRGGVGVTTIQSWVKRETGVSAEEIARLMRERQSVPIEVPITAIYSKSDGVVAWQACIDETNPRVDHREVACSHVGMACSAVAFREVAKALAEPLD